MVAKRHFTTTERRQQWPLAKEKLADQTEEPRIVGAVALGTHGNSAAASWTGGMTYKSVGRIVDVFITDAGIYADNQLAVAW